VDIADLGPDPREVECVFPAGVLDVSGNGVGQIGDVLWRGRLSRQNDRVRMAGRVEGMLEVACDRCLEPAKVPLAHDFELFFEPRDRLEYEENVEIELDEPDTRTSFLTGGELEIGDVVLEQLLLALPMKPLCRDDCAGLCPVCGLNLNLSSCDCTVPRVESAFSVLGELKARLEKQSS
jgi:uncharacterized protein